MRRDRRGPRRAERGRRPACLLVACAFPGMSRAAFTCALAARLPARVTALAAVGGVAGDTEAGAIYVGTSAGQLLAYSVDAAAAGAPAVASPAAPGGAAVLRASTSAGPSPVDALLFLPGAEGLLCACGGAATLRQLGGKLHGEELRALRGLGSCAAVDASARGCALGGRGATRVAAAVRKKLLLMAVAPGRSAMLAEVPLPEAPTSLAWCGDACVVALRGRYLLASGLRGGGSGGVSAAVVTELLPLPPDAPPARCVPLPAPAGEGALLLVDRAGLLADMAGVPKATSFSFTDPPAALARAGAYVLAAHAGRVDVYRPGTETVVQALPLDHAGDATNIVLSGDGGGGAPPHSALGACAAGAALWVLAPVPVLEQARALLDAGRCADAVALVESDYEGEGREREEALTDVRVAAAFALLRALRFAEAAVALRACVGALHPAEVFGFFPRLAGGRYLPHAPPALEPRPRAEDMARLVRDEVAAGLPQRRRRGSDVEAKPVGPPPSEAALLARAARCVAGFLSAARQNVPPATRLAEAVDTTLLLLLCSASGAEDTEAAGGTVEAIEALVDAGGFCGDLALCESALEDTERAHALALLRRRRDDAAAALEAWAALGRGEVLEGASVGGDGAVAREAASMADADGATVSAAAAAQRGAARRVAARAAMVTLRDGAAGLSPDAALEHVSWAAAVDPVAAVEALAAPPPSSLASLAPADALAALQRAELSEAQRDDVAWRYLEHVVRDTAAGAESETYHTELALCAARAALNARDAPEGTEAGAALLSHLATSRLLCVPQVLRAVAGTRLYRARVVLHGRMGDHLAALRILAITLRDAEAAERYCQQAGGDEAYLQLLGLYLDPKGAQAGEANADGSIAAPLEPDYEAAADLLASRGASLDPRDVLEALPSAMPLAAAMAPLGRMLQDRATRCRQAQVARSLARADNLAAAYARLGELDRRVTVTDDKVRAYRVHACCTLEVRLNP